MGGGASVPAGPLRRGWTKLLTTAELGLPAGRKPFRVERDWKASSLGKPGHGRKRVNLWTVWNRKGRKQLGHPEATNPVRAGCCCRAEGAAALQR